MRKSCLCRLENEIASLLATGRLVVNGFNHFLFHLSHTCVEQGLHLLVHDIGMVMPEIVFGLFKLFFLQLIFLDLLLLGFILFNPLFELVQLQLSTDNRIFHSNVLFLVVNSSPLLELYEQILASEVIQNLSCNLFLPLLHFSVLFYGFK
jgi:hypothetical protein